ncbi:PREDICTED: protein dopey-1 homolog [Rhagoletis zephyria]|uniref:protein dopey-1 homolog n=1 Tax=Rhagoletis zephyria TaxID=28612 RepID=UPI00081146F9|nr:PREDICTED: protein dopey-1 homolog [Rhagoletis zephyria]
MDTADALMEEKKLLAETKYRNYMSNIDKALRNFEYSSEWADLISALGKLSKAISSNTQYQVIPRRIKISKRLAQCMHPALPSGVHLKALETYDVIFSKTGAERLAQELFIYSAGLFPLLGYAAMNVRPALLGIYETYFVPLGDKLRPALSGFLSGVLPGYENGLDHFDRTNSLLTQVCTAVNPTHFYTVLWECMATNASIRLPAVTYLLEHFNKRMSMQEQVFIMGHNRDIMMSGLCACLNDSVILVQRNTLEFLLLGFPMHTIYLTEADLIKLVTNGLNTILRRDMSLNRRLYSWLLGSEVAKNSPTYDTASLDGPPAETETYFEKHSKHIVIQSLICTLKFSLESTPVDLKPYRIMVSLLDKAEIGSAVLDHVLCDIIRTMSLSSSSNVEVVKSANLLFATFDPAYIWSFMTSMYDKSCKKSNKSISRSQSRARLSRSISRSSTETKFQCEVGSGDPSLVEICYLTEFLLETISLEMYNETTRIYLPKVFLAITQMLTIHLDNIGSDEITASLKLCMKIVSRVQPMITSPIKLLPRTNHGYYSSSDEKGASANKGVLKNTSIAQVAGAMYALEKSKSDSKLNHFSGDESTIMSHGRHKEGSVHSAYTEPPMRRSNSNQHMERKSPKKKKAKSTSKLSELDKEICPDTGQIIEPQSSSDLDTPLSIKKLKSKAKTPYMRIRTSPKKTRPKNIALSGPKSLDPSMLKTTDETDDQPKSAPATEQLSKDRVEELIFDYNDVNANNEQEFTILEKCIRQYEIFFELYLTRHVLQIKQSSAVDEEKCRIKVEVERDQPLSVEHIFQNEQIFEDLSPERLLEVERLFDTLRVNVMSRSKQLHSLLNRSLGHTLAATSTATDSTTSDASDDGDDSQDASVLQKCDERTERRIQTLMDLRVSNSQRRAIKLAANLLVEMSTFPNCNKNIVLDKNDKEIPSWLKVLCLGAAYTESDKELQLAAITTLFDLISLLKSQIEHTTSPGVTFVVMLPLLKFGHVSYIEHKTRIFQLVTSVLWNNLGEAGIDPAQITALLYQLHNCLESGLVETVIGNRMYAHSMHQQFAAADALATTGWGEQYNSLLPQTALRNYRYDRARDVQLVCASPARPVSRSAIEQLKESESKSFRKFELLWHLGRDKQPSKGFEKTLLKVLDTLALPQYMSVRTCVTKWLQSALLRGDLPRLIKPLYKILLGPQTKRIGIMHLHLLQQEDGATLSHSGDKQQQGGNQGDSSLERGVYAISSEYGNIKYHMETSSSKKRSPIRSFHKKIFGVTLSSKNKTSNFVSDKTPPQAIAATETADATIGLIVNPLDNSPDFDDEGDNDTECEMLETTSKTDAKTTESVKVDDDVEEEDDEKEELDPHDFEHDYTDDSESSMFDSESENRETSVEKDDSLTISSSAGAINSNVTVSGNLKRFVGDCERVTELLSQHERTKNRKTYRLTREKTPGDSSLASVTSTTDEQSSLGPQSQSGTLDESAHPADEYFNANNNTSQADAVAVETNVKNLVEPIPVPPAATRQPQRQRDEETHKHKQHRAHGTTKQHKKKHAAGKKSPGSSDKKRMSCISKTSTDSNNSYSGNAGPNSLQEEHITCNSLQSDDDDEGLYESRSQSNSLTTASTINVEEKRRTLSLETSQKPSSQKSEWGLTQETLEKSKQNLQILRQNAAASQQQQQSAGDAGSKRSSMKSGNSSISAGDSSTRLAADQMPCYYQHMLIYAGGAYDTKQTLYAFQTLRNIITCDTRTFLCLSITTSVASGTLKQLLIRHRKCMQGKGFAGSISNTEYAQSYRACMHLEVLVTICLYYARGFFHHEARYADSAADAPTAEDVMGNCRVQLESVELLSLICAELIDIVRGMGKGLACYIADLMARCKLQKVILHCLNSSVSMFTVQQRQQRQRATADSLPARILNFNNPLDDQLHAESLQLQLLRLLMSVIKLEYEVQLLKHEGSGANVSTASGKEDSSGNISPTRLSNIAGDSSATNVKYLPNCLISQQPMFLAAVLSALQNEQLRHLHRNWTDLVTASLNCFSCGSLTNIVISVVHQLCHNIDRIAKLTLKEQSGFPPDYVVSQLEAITILCHYCLLDNTQQTTLSHLFNQAYPQTSVAAQSSNTGQLLNNIVHSFLSTAAAAAAAAAAGTSQSSEAQAPRNPQLLAARNAVLSHLSRIVTSVAAVWDSELGQVRPVKQQLMEFLSPVSLHHGANFLAAVAVTWQERGEAYAKRAKPLSMLSIVEQYQRNSAPQACAEQLSLVTLVSSIRVMPMDSFVQTLHQVVRNPPPIHRPPVHLTIEVSALELFYFYMKSAPAPQLGDSWSSLLALLRDGLSLTPPAQFVLLMLLNEFVQRCPQMPFPDKKDIRDLHDVTARLVDSLSNVAGSCLEQTTWLRRNLAVKEDIHPLTSEGSVRDSIGGQQQQYAAQAQSVLAATLANLLDVAYGSQEKDKVVNIITTLLYNITPYLKNHTSRNVPAFYACSSLLASLSGYQYTRKAWRKDMLDLLLDNSFFQLDISCLPFWKQIMDSLMTYDNTTFRELMSRVSLTQTGSLNIFTSREQEYEQRSMLLKRLAFVIFCSEFDQYHKYMPEIQEQLANSLRLLSMVPSVQAAVFLCFRVLLLRMSADHVTSLWPIIIAEMVHVFLAMEQELKSDSEDLSQQMRLLSGMDVSWSSNSSGNGLSSQNQVTHWRSVQLEASKLLELGCVLPATNLPHFQMYRWAFVGTEFDVHEDVPIMNGSSDEQIATATLPTTIYVPHIRRIARLMDMKYAVHSPTNNVKRGRHLMLTYQQINSLGDLYGFFSTLSVNCPNPHNHADIDKEVASCLAEIEDVLAKDFLERMPTSTTPR